jgi:hypothetical protein
VTTFNELLSQHVGASFARQRAFADFLGDRSWGVDMRQGTCQFGNDLAYPIQLLGTEAEGDSTWLWAWANEASNLPTSLLTACTGLRELGEQEKISEFYQRSFSIDVADGHSIALIASGLDSKSCYYRGPYDGGALFFLVNGVPDEILQPAATERMLTIISEVISQFIVPHRSMVLAFLASQGFIVDSTTHEVSGVRGADKLTFAFDAQDRISQMDGSLHPKT